MTTPNNELERSTSNSIKAFNPDDEAGSVAKPQQLSILIADDEKRMTHLLAKCCQGLGHRVVGIAANGKEAINLAQELNPDVVFLDVNMPGMDGIDAAKAILRIRNVAVIFSTGASDIWTLRRVQQLGIAGYLVKPFSPAQLKAALHMAVSPATAGETHLKVVNE